MSTETLQIDRNVGDFSYPEQHAFDAGTGLTKDTIHYISDVKDEPQWIRDFRLKALEIFESKPMPTHWASEDLNAIVFDRIRYYLAHGQRATRSWEEVP